MDNERKITICILILLVCIICYKIYMNNAKSDQQNQQNVYSNWCLNKKTHFCSNCGYRKNNSCGCSRLPPKHPKVFYIKKPVEYFVERNTATTDDKIKLATQVNTQNQQSNQTSSGNKADTSTVPGLNTNITNIDNKVIRLQPGLEISDT